MNLIDKINKKQINPNIPEFRVGDTVRVGVKINEGKRERVQVFEGVVTSKKGGGVSETFTVRKKLVVLELIEYFQCIHQELMKLLLLKKEELEELNLISLKVWKVNIKLKKENNLSFLL